MADLYKRDFALVCLSALRYAYGRETYMPKITTDFIRRNAEYIGKMDLELMLRDTEEAIGEGRTGHPVIDRPNWLEFRDWLKEEIDRRDDER